MREAAGIIFLLLAGWFSRVIFCVAIGDARRRGMSVLLVLIAVGFFFPFGLLAWLLFHSPKQGPRLPNVTANPVWSFPQAHSLLIRPFGRNKGRRPSLCANLIVA